MTKALKETPEEVLGRLWYDAEGGYSGGEDLYQRYHKLDNHLPLTRNEVRAWLAKQTASQISRVGGPKMNIPITAPGPFESLQADLLDVRNIYPKANQDVQYLLVMVDIYSRFCWVAPLKSKSAVVVVEGFSEVLKMIDEPIRSITTDRGAEFISLVWRGAMSRQHIKHYLAETRDHTRMGIVERLNRTLRTLFTKYLVGNDTHKWIDALPEIIKGYNNRLHTGIRAVPQEVVLSEVVPAARKDSTRVKKAFDKFKVGVRVRVRRAKREVSAKGVGEFSKDLYTVRSTEGFKVFLKGLSTPYRFQDLLIVESPPELNPRIIKPPSEEDSDEPPHPVTTKKRRAKLPPKQPRVKPA